MREQKEELEAKQIEEERENDEKQVEKSKEKAKYRRTVEKPDEDQPNI